MNLARIGFRIFAALVASPFCSASLMAAATNQPSQILFLHLRMHGNAVSLLNSSPSPGVLKPQPNPEAREIQYELLSSSGEVLWKGGLDDPSLKQIDYQDPPRSGRFKRKVIHVRDVEFTVRVPLSSGAQRIEFFRVETMPGDTPAKNHSIRKPLGSVSVPSTGLSAP
jgi:hypothetical protein